ncbi:RNA polymerase sigma factor [Oleiagrimonas soli]|uniref:RNA polymerase sigma factor (Sigma-70 family) n=1 Tax=Oleiagrimonas soli TaxID=1543381 RepID=A0A099CVM2_9GAMM|nr:RNA polymerase sigma factor [Oleiagrimonas soli]KGI77667.1 RNA polymerase subunit sigma-24 [Oleiagrimonas soli]MBB6182811.1 RNA polymerase sigma factor (sigma-70 family) [Oleiagrimonas soli]
MATDPHHVIEVVWREEAARLVAGLARMTRDFSLAEELAQDALVAALERWPDEGVPDRPGAWLMTTAKRRAIDRLRRDAMLSRKHEQLVHELEAATRRGDPQDEIDPDDDIGDELLRLVFTACHPALSTEARVALTLRVLGGLTTPEVARAFLVSEATVAQRIVRAKRTLEKKQVPFEVPRGTERNERLASVLEVVYLIFNEGYAATAGDDWVRPALCEDALRLGRVLASLAPQEPEVSGLLALMELQASRMQARVDGDGELVLLMDQDRDRWDRQGIERGLDALAHAEALHGRGPYALQAAIAACHARASSPEATDWPRIADLYATLAEVMPSPVVELNRAVAEAMAYGPQVGLDRVDTLTEDPLLANYHLLPSVRADLLLRLGCRDEARAEFERAAALAQNARERALLQRRAWACMSGVD